ncbi:MAG TPA: hypothetical protein PLL69_04350 [Gemmatimonadales bacterium]|nr:hypothetical protein [Gemmatimonadales bacterium]
MRSDLRNSASLILSVLLNVSPLVGQSPPSVTVSGGVANAYRGTGVSGSARLEWQLHSLSRDADLLLGGGAWIAQTGVHNSELHRTAWGAGPQIGIGWYPAGSAWRFYAGTGVELLRSFNENPLVPVDDPEPALPPASDYAAADGTGAGAAFTLRFSTPPGGGAALELGAVATRHALFDGGAVWWTRYEIGLRFGGGRR